MTESFTIARAWREHKSLLADEWTNRDRATGWNITQPQKGTKG